MESDTQSPEERSELEVKTGSQWPIRVVETIGKTKTASKGVCIDEEAKNETLKNPTMK